MPSDADRIAQALDRLAESDAISDVSSEFGLSPDELVSLVAETVAGLLESRRVVSSSQRNDDRAENLASTAHFPRDRELTWEATKTVDGGLPVLLRHEPDMPLTTTRAAAMLGVSRPFLVRLLEEGHIPFHKVGRDRRVMLSDVQAYLAEREAATARFREE